MTTGMLVIWSLFHSNTGTHMPCSNGFVRIVGSDMNCQ